jgi:hypothetical protein
VITATAAGGKTATANAEVVPAHVGAKLSKFDAEAATKDFSTVVDDATAILDNGASVSVGALRRGAGTNEYCAYIGGGADTDASKPVPVVLTVTGADGAPAEDIGKFALSLPSGVAARSGEYLADASIASGSAILLLDFGGATSHTVGISAADHTPLSLTLYFVPQGGTTLDAVTVKGDAVDGGTLAADAVTAGGAPKESGFAYQWLRSRYADEGYAPIPDATAASYSPTEADKGLYIKLRVTGTGGESALYGEALSAAKGPVVSVADEVFAAIEAVWLGGNASANYVTKNLNLPKSFDAYPGVTVAWTAEPAGTVNADTGAVTRPADADVRVTLTATLGGLAAGTRAFEVNVLMQGVGDAEQKGTDARFKPGYPRSFIQKNTDGESEVWVEFELTEAAQVYLLVRLRSGYIETKDPQSVLNGYAGEANNPQGGDDSPVFFAEAGTKIRYNTTHSLNATVREIRLDFVLTDRNDREKHVGEVVTIHYDAATVSELDEQAPRPVGSFLNAAKNKIYLYFNEPIASNGLAASDFALNAGTVVSAGLENYEESELAESYVVLGVSGISDADAPTLRLSYKGGTIADNSVNKNKAEAFDSDDWFSQVRSAATSIESVYIGNDGRTLRVDVKGGPNHEELLLQHEWEDTKSFFTFTPGGAAVTVSESISNGAGQVGNGMYAFRFDTALDAGLQVTYDMGSIPNWAYDTEAATTEGVTGDMTGKATAPLTVSYSKGARAFTLTYAEDLLLDNGGFTDGFVATIGGKDYKLRDFNAFLKRNNQRSNQIEISLNVKNRNGVENDDYLKFVAGLIESAPGGITLSYSLAHGTSQSQITDIGRALLPAFGPQAVTVTD